MEKILSPFKNCSPRNFALDQDRLAMKSAVEHIHRQLGMSYRLGDGQSKPERENSIKYQASLNPSNKKEVVGFVEFGDEKDLETAISQCDQGRRSWGKTEAWERIQLVEALADWMQERRDILSAWMVFEVGKNWREADADTCEAIDFCRYYAREMASLSKPIRMQELAGETNDLLYFPRGVFAVIAPWNFPLAILTGMTVASLVAGNSVIIKPAEQSSVIGAFLAQGLKEVGFPKDSFYFLPGEGEKLGPLLVSDPRVDGICFTGSVEVGLSIIEGAAAKPKEGQRGVKKVIAEMGGKNALIVDEDADLDEAVAGSIHSAFGFQGQKCSALSRLIVHDRVYESFVSRFVAASKSLRTGPAWNPEFQVGPVVDDSSFRRIRRCIQDASSRLEVLYIGETDQDQGYFIPPAIFEVPDRSDTLFQNEVFGPVVAVHRVKSLDEAFEAVNSVRFALTGGIYSRSPSHISRARKEMEVGNLYINRSITGAIVGRQAFGGFKFSGVGSKAGGPDYLLQFLEPRLHTENTVRRGFAAEEA
ncbi:MAG: aldehyde dehydrogenase family protein [Bradymonadales bacterium]|nr:MAG: aldehyde dehydrogenase family protein [Bradymonadales bacterium]